MFLRCLCSSLPKPCAYSSKNKFYEFVKNRRKNISQTISSRTRNVSAVTYIP